MESMWYRHQLARLVKTDDIGDVGYRKPTARKIKANRPDVCLSYLSSYLIDIIYPADGNVMLRSWQSIACGDKPHVANAGGLGSLHGHSTVHAGIARWLDIIPGDHNLQHLQQTVLLGSPRILPN